MKQGLIEKISKNKELPKTMLDVYRCLGYMNYKFGLKNIHINDYENLCLIAKSLNGLDWNPEVNNKLEFYYPYFRWNSSSERFDYVGISKNQVYYYVSFALGFKTRELAEYAGETFIDQYNKWLTIQKSESKLIEEVNYREIKTMSDVYKINGITKLTTHPETKERYYEDLILISKALNGNWQPDWNDSDECKYSPYFTFASVLRFSFTGYYYWDAIAAVGSCLCFKNRELAEYAGKQFVEQYKKIMKFY
jgi:hypothetical protein